jgi:hypothetical protein
MNYDRYSMPPGGTASGSDQEEAKELDYKTRCAFEATVDNSIVEQYDGPLDRLGEDQHGVLCYAPLDTDHIRTLLISLWGDLLSAEAIEEAFERRMAQGEWPRGYCEEDEEDLPLSSCGPD